MTAEEIIANGGTLIAEAETALSSTVPVADRIAAVEALYQEVVNFLHHHFPGHFAPGTPSVPPTA